MDGRSGGVLDEQALLLRSGTKQETNTLLLLKDAGTSGLATKSCLAWKGLGGPWSTVYFLTCVHNIPTGKLLCDGSLLACADCGFNECQVTQL